jgi:hypothetical protein
LDGGGRRGLTIGVLLEVRELLWGEFALRFAHGDDSGGGGGGSGGRVVEVVEIGKLVCVSAKWWRV